MAIIFEQQKRAIPWVKILFIAFSVAFVAAAVFYLFFAPSPQIEVLLPEPLLRTSKIADLEFVDISEVVNHEVFQSLQQYFGAPGIGILGRQNPFAPF